MFNSNVPSLADIAAVTNNDGFGGNNGWWILIILFALFGGWGNGYGRGGVQEDYVLASDFANIERKIDGVNNGLCDVAYAQNTSLLNGFNNTQMAMNNLGFQLQQCCCDNKAMIADLKYDMAMQTQNVMLNCNNNYRQLHDEMEAFKLEAKNERIAELTSKVQALELRASQQEQNNVIINTLRPAAVPAYTVANPYYGYGYQCNNGGCGCN